MMNRISGDRASRLLAAAFLLVSCDQGGELVAGDLVGRWAVVQGGECRLEFRSSGRLATERDANQRWALEQGTLRIGGVPVQVDRISQNELRVELPPELRRPDERAETYFYRCTRNNPLAPDPDPAIETISADTPIR